MSDLKKIWGPLLLMGIGYFSVTYVLSEVKRNEAEAFFMEGSNGDFRSARTRLTPGLANLWTEKYFAARFGGIKPFESVSLPFFASRLKKSQINLNGSAETASGCTSDVFIEFENVWFGYFGGDGVGRFEIHSLCYD